MSNPPVSSHAIASNVFVKLMTFVKAGDCNHGHCHTYDHLTLLSAGSLEIHCDGVVGRFKAPHIFMTPKGKVHQFFALEDGTVVACIHALRDRDISDDIIPPESTLEYAAKQMEHVLMQIEAQTTVVVPRPASSAPAQTPEI